MAEIPEKAKRVFKGVIFDVYQWDQEMFDGTREKFEMLKRPDSVQVIPILDNDKILILEQQQPGTKVFTSFAGGRVDQEKDHLEAAKRELLEETGYKANKFILWKEFQAHSKIDWTIYYYIAKDCKKVQDQSLDSGEKIMLKEITFEEFLNLGKDKKFRIAKLAPILLKAKYDEKYREKLRKLFFN